MVFVLDSYLALIKKMNITDLLFYLFLICIGILIILDAYLIGRLMDLYPEEYEKAGKPWAFWSDHRSLVFAGYILRGEYKNIQNGTLVNVFNAARVLTIIQLLLFLLLSISMIFEINGFILNLI